MLQKCPKPEQWLKFFFYKNEIIYKTLYTIPKEDSMHFALTLIFCKISLNFM